MNYETQMVNLWFGEYLSQYGTELSPTQLRNAVEEQLFAQLNGNSFVSDIISRALSRVDWDELAELYEPDILYDEP